MPRFASDPYRLRSRVTGNAYNGCPPELFTFYRHRKEVKFNKTTPNRFHPDLEASDNPVRAHLLMLELPAWVFCIAFIIIMTNCCHVRGFIIYIICSAGQRDEYLNEFANSENLKKIVSASIHPCTKCVHMCNNGEGKSITICGKKRGNVCGHFPIWLRDHNAMTLENIKELIRIKNAF